MFYKYSEEELRAVCRTSIETLENWARRLIDEKLAKEYGTEYIDKKTNGENYLFNHELRDRVHHFREKNEYSRTVDAFQFKDIINILCRKDLYKLLFKDALQKAYPLGATEIRIMLTKVMEIRNLLSHANTISTHQAEQAVCYSHDFVEGLKEYYKEIGMEQTWNVPRIIRVSDSLGNDFENLKELSGLGSYLDLKHDFFCGETYNVYVKVDSSFSPEEYDIKWMLNGRHEQIGELEYCVTFDEKDIREHANLTCTITSKNNWHKYGKFDFKLVLWFNILPTII